MRRFGIIFVVSAALLIGCATRRQVQELKIEVDSISADLKGIRADNARLDSLFRTNVYQSRKLNADFATYVTRLDERMQMVEARLEDAVTLINRASGAIESRSPVRQSQVVSQNSTDVDSTKAAGKVDCQKVYSAAYFDAVKQNYDFSIKGFQNYLTECPRTALADNAQYWIGECYYLEKKYELAQKAFKKMIDNYPSSEQMAPAKLKMGKSMYNQRLKTKAKSVFQDIVKNYPGTEEAQEASQMLERYR
ncbi:MAG: tol-pal system protein YbgF [candidate division Zixibacteria bacterium]